MGVARLRGMTATVRGKILLAFCALAAITSVLGFSALSSVDDSGRLVVETYDKPLMSTSYARLGLAVFMQMELALAERRSTSDAERRQALGERIDDLFQSLSEDLGVARARASSARAAGAASETARLAAEWNAMRRKIGAGAFESASEADLDALAVAVVNSFDDLVEVTAEDGFRDRERALASISRYRELTIGGTVVALLLGVVVAFLLARHMVRPIAAASNAAKRIAEGELDVEISPAGNDELTLLLRSMAVMRDNIREMMEREIAARRSAQTRLLNAIESSAEAVILVDSEDRIQISNSQTAAFFPALSDGFAAGRQLPAEVGAALLQPTGEISLSDGRWLRLNRSGVADGGYVIIGTDITQLKERENLLRAAKEQAEEASRSKSQFLANMSHELRTPLNAILGFSEIIRDSMMGPVNARYKEYAHDIFNSGNHLLSLINEVLDLSKIEVGRLDLRDEIVDISRLLADCDRLVGGRAREANIRLAYHASEDLPHVRADERRLKQVILNLLSNAVKFTPSGGEVVTSASATLDGSIMIAVSDTGIGMRCEDVPTAMEPFRQLDDGLNRRYEGTGLGLPLAQRLVELHGGGLSIETAPGRGTTVRVSLPAERCIRRVA